MLLDDLGGGSGSERVVVSGNVVDGVSFELGFVGAEHAVGGVSRVDVAGGGRGRRGRKVMLVWS